MVARPLAPSATAPIVARITATPMSIPLRLNLALTTARDISSPLSPPRGINGMSPLLALIAPNADCRTLDARFAPGVNPDMTAFHAKRDKLMLD